MKATKKIPHSEERERKISGKQKKEVLQQAREKKREKEGTEEEEAVEAEEAQSTEGKEKNGPSRPPKIADSSPREPPRVSEKVRMKR